MPKFSATSHVHGVLITLAFLVPAAQAQDSKSPAHEFQSPVARPTAHPQETRSAKTSEPNLIDHLSDEANVPVSLEKPVTGKGRTYSGVVLDSTPKTGHRLSRMVDLGTACGITLKPILGDPDHWLEISISSKDNPIQGNLQFQLPRKSDESGWFPAERTIRLVQRRTLRGSKWLILNRSIPATYTLTIQLNESLTAVRSFRYQFETEGNQTVYKYDTTFYSPFFYFCGVR